MKILYITTIGGTMTFFKSFIKQLIDDGHTVDITTNEKTSVVPDCYREWGCTIHQISTSRSPFDRGNIKAIKQIKKLVEKEKYDIVHCHTPVAAACTRLACRKARKNGTRVIYTAHGFHFYKGAPVKNWLVYYPAEKICSCFTDVLITINKEDYALAQRKMKTKKIEYVPGVGIDLDKFRQTQINKVAKCKELGVPPNEILLLSVGELNENKNHETAIRAIADLDVYYIIAGSGDLQEYLQGIIDELGLTGRVKLLGYRADVAELYSVADVYVLPSIREGLNVSVMEAMASGLPCVVSDIRGNVDMVDRHGGYLFPPQNNFRLKEAIELVVKNTSDFGNYNKSKSCVFSNKLIDKIMMNIYQEV